MNTGNGYQNAVLQDALYVPDLNGNLLSVSHFACRRSEIQFTGEGCQLLNQHKNTACIGHLRGNLYIMDIKVTTIESAKLATVPTFPSEGEEAPALALTACTKPSSTDLQTWHRQLGHLSPAGSLLHAQQEHGHWHGNHRRKHYRYAVQAMHQRQAVPCRHSQIN